jgi:RNA polymerase sigma-70 factor (ECF subfamily)
MALRLTGGDEAAAGDITQHTFVKLFTSGGTFRGEGSLASWIYATASNAAMSERRRNVRLVRNPVETSETPDPGADIDMQSERHRLDGAVARLPEKQRLVLSMRVDTEMPFEQIARAAGMSVNSAKVNYHHAVTALKRLLAAEDGK